MLNTEDGVYNNLAMTGKKQLQKPAFLGYLCPVCIVRFPYAHELAEHWICFHIRRFTGKELKSCPSLGHAARKRRSARNTYPQKSNKVQFPSEVSHTFCHQKVNKHNPKTCHFCKQIIWDYARLCSDCGLVCHIDCQHMIVTGCGCMMNLQRQSVGETTHSEQIGDIRECVTSSIHIKRSRSKSIQRNSLDLTYITDRLVALTFPASGQEIEYRTSLIEALKSLQDKHAEKFRIINVSERRYDILQMSEPGQVLDYGWPDHLAPPLQKIDQIINSVHCWLQADIKNVAVIHCKGGKSRIGLVVASYIQFSKNLPSPQGALDWFALKRYYDSTLEGATHPSQKRYVRYYGELYENTLQISNKPLLFQNMILHGIPPYDSAGYGLKFRLKIYQGYHLVHTSKTLFVPSDCQRFSISFPEALQLEGDIMVKCIQQGNSSTNTIFRIQFHSDAIEGCVTSFGKYDLDEAFADQKYPDWCFVELVFAPTSMEQVEDIFDRERKMDGHIIASTGDTPHLAGPVNGSPYAQIDPHLKDRLKTSAFVEHEKEFNLKTGIEDLDGLLGDLGYTSAEPDVNANTCYQIEHKSYYSNNRNHQNGVNKIKVKRAPVVTEGRIKVEQRGQLHEAPPIYQRNVSSDPDNEVFTTHSSVNTVNDLLYELDNSTLNSSNSAHNLRKATRNASSYDNDSVSDLHEVNGRTESVDGVMEIKSGTVAQHIKSLNKVLFKDVSEYSKKYGVPMAGVNAPNVVEERVSAFNSRSVAPGFCSTSVGEIYQSQGGITKIDYEFNHNGDQLFTYPAEEMCSMDEDDPSKMSSLLSRSDSAYGESMRSSSPSPVVTPTSSRQHVTSPEVNNNKNTNHDMHNEESSASPSNSPRSDINRKSSGIDSPVSSMNSLDCDEDGSVNSISISVNNYQHQQNHQQQKQPVISSRLSTDRLQQHVNLAPSQLPSRNIDFVQFSPYQQLQPLPQQQQDAPLDHGSYNTVIRNSRPSNMDVVVRGNGQTLNKPIVVSTSSIEMHQPKHTLTVVEECIQPSQIQKEVESLNNELFKNLLDEDFGKPAVMPVSIPYQSNNHMMVNSSNIRTHGLYRDIDSHDHVHFEYGSKNSTPSSPRRFPSLPDAHKTDGNGNNFISHTQHVYTRTRTLSNGSSTTSDEAISPRSPASLNGSWNGGGSGRSTLRLRRYKSTGESSNSSVSSGELFPDIVRYPNVKFDKDTMNLWYKPSITRDEATVLLKNKRPGAFVVRDSQSYDGAFGLAVKVETPPPGVLQQVGGDITKIDLDNELVRHFLVEPCKKGVRLKGSNEEPTFPSLVALIYQHSLTKMALPVPLIIPETDLVDGPTNALDLAALSEAQLLQKGAACNLVYLGAVKVDTLTGDGAVQYSMNKVTSPNVQLKTTVVNIKVNQSGITLTDNNRRVFFRKHFPMSDILHCGVDPKGRKINLKSVVEDTDREAGCFGFVAKKQANSQENHCHVFAEMELDQPASAVINFIHKAMRYGRV